MRISHEAIYQALYIESRGALTRELVACLRAGRALRTLRARSRQRARGHVTDDVLISERPAEVEDRAVPGHWEGDLIIGTGRSAIGTVVERATRFTMLVHLPRKEGWGDKAPIKNGPALGGYGAESMRDALTNGFSVLPDQLCRSLTWDQGKELSAHAEFTVKNGIPVFFADPHSPWQRGTNENANGVLRQYFQKGTDLSRWSRDELEAVATTLNARPRKILRWRSPAEALDAPSQKPVLLPPVESTLTAAIRMVHQFSVRLTTSKRHHQRVDNKISGLAFAHRPADHRPSTGHEDRRSRQGTISRPNI
jgi:IS30 family transposase